MIARQVGRVGWLWAIAAAIAVAPDARAASAPTHLQVQGLLVDRIAAQVLPPLARVPEGAVLSLRDAGEDELAQVIADSLAAALTRRGVEVWIAPSKPGALDSTLVSSWVLDLTVAEARLVVGAPRKGFLVLKGGRSHREASVRLTASLRPSAKEPPVWTGSPSAVYVDDFPADAAAAVGAGIPAWMTQALASAPKASPAKSGWLERTAVLGLIGGIVLIYAAGAN